MDERKSPCVLQDFVPFGAAALPLILIYNHAKQGNGYRVLPLGDLFALLFPPSFYIQVNAGHAIKSLTMSDESREAYLANLRCELRRITNKEEKNVSQLVSPLSPQMLKQFDFDSTATAKFQKWIPRDNVRQ